MMVGRLLSFWDGLFSGAMLVSGKVHVHFRWFLFIRHFLTAPPVCKKLPGKSSKANSSWKLQSGEEFLRWSTWQQIVSYQNIWTYFPALYIAWWNRKCICWLCRRHGGKSAETFPHPHAGSVNRQDIKKKQKRGTKTASPKLPRVSFRPVDLPAWLFYVTSYCNWWIPIHDYISVSHCFKLSHLILLFNC